MDNSSDELIKAKIKGRVVTYYLTTEDDLQNVKDSSKLSEFFTLLFSITIGGIVSTVLTKSTGVQISQAMTNMLNILLWVFVIGALIFGFLMAYFFIRPIQIIGRIKGSGAVKSIDTVTYEEAPIYFKSVINEKHFKAGIKEKAGLKINDAVYWTPSESIDVTEELRKMVVNNRIETVASNEIAGDPQVGVKKKLIIVYELDGIAVTREFNENDKVVLP